MRLLWLEQRTDNGVKPREALGFIQGMTGSHWKVLPPGLQYKEKQMRTYVKWTSLD